MRSGITTISVNFPTFPAKGLQLEPNLCRAKSFIRSISEIGANQKIATRSGNAPNRQKVTKIRVFCSGPSTQTFAMYVISKMLTEWPTMRTSPSFLRNNDFFLKVDISFKNNSRKLSINVKNRKKDALQSLFWIAPSCQFDGLRNRCKTHFSS